MKTLPREQATPLGRPHSKKGTSLSGYETDDQGVTQDILAVVESITTRLAVPSTDSDSDFCEKGCGHGKPVHVKICHHGHDFTKCKSRKLQYPTEKILISDFSKVKQEYDYNVNCKQNKIKLTNNNYLTEKGQLNFRKKLKVSKSEEKLSSCRESGGILHTISSSASSSESQYLIDDSFYGSLHSEEETMTDKANPQKSKQRIKDGTPRKTRKLKKKSSDDSDEICSNATDSSMISHTNKSPNKHSRKKSGSLSSTAELEIPEKSKHRHKEATTCKSPSKSKHYGNQQGRQSVESMSSAGESDTEGQLSPIIPNSAEPQRVSFSSLKSKNNTSPQNSRTGTKKRPISSALVLDSSGSEDEAGPNLQNQAITDTPKRNLRSSMDGDEDLLEGGDLTVHSLDGNVDDFSLWLIKAPAEMSLKSMPKSVMVEEITNFTKKKNSFEVWAFSDEAMQTDYLSWVKNKSGGLSLGPKISGQIHFMDLPTEQQQGQGRPTRPLIVSKPVPFPQGLKARFQPFGADAPVVTSKKRKKSLPELESSISKATDQIDGVVPKKKKKKKKHKHKAQ